MCEWCEKELARRGNGDESGIICPTEAGKAVASVINKRLKNEPMTDVEVGLLDTFLDLACCGRKGGVS